MIKISDIYKTVCELISSETNITVEDSDIEEPVVRPSFKIFMDTVRTGLYNKALRQVKCYFNIYFYAQDRDYPKAEIFETENTLSFIFLEPLVINNTCAVYIDDVNFEKVDDGILNLSFDFEVAAEYIDESNLEMMEELTIKDYLKEEYINGNKTNY